MQLNVNNVSRYIVCVMISHFGDRQTSGCLRGPVPSSTHLARVALRVRSTHVSS